ncbi:hypothetical protein [Maritalea sp.]|uniref:hypothetical protein n=1 Tax=Maritalea sp. TaxID=2003361 RepID=UPI003EF83FA2
MSPDYDKYRALAKAEGDQTVYSDDDLLPLWGAMEHLFATTTQVGCPHIFAAQEVSLSPKDPLPALDSKHISQTKEPKE